MYFKKSLLILVFTALVSSCSTIDFIRCFSIDGKQAMSCERGLRAGRICKDKKGLKDYRYHQAECNDGTVFRSPY